MKSFFADLHIHTALSPCGGEEMTPPAIVQAATDRGLGLIAICDHNSAGNVAAVQLAAARIRRSRREIDLTVIAGLEVTTREEVHVVALMPGAEAAAAVSAVVQATLPEADEAARERFGEQRLLDAAGVQIGREPRLLAAASTLDLGDVVSLVHAHGGMAIAAHVNRPSFSVLSQLGLFPREAGFDAVEVFIPCGSPEADKGSLLGRFAALGLPLICSSDAHYPGDIGRCRTVFELQAPTFEELTSAIRGEGGRSIRCA